jgi:hypothetical protein
MGSTAATDAPAKTAGNDKNDSDKTAAVKQDVARKSPQGGKTAGKQPVSRNRKADAGITEKPRKKAAPAGNQTAGKSRRKNRSATRETGRPDMIAPQTGGPETADATTAAAAMTENPANPADKDSRSISWMSAQAVSALNAVKASQARKAESLLARVEKPVPGRPGITELPEQTIEDLLEEFPGMEAATPAAPDSTAPQETTTTPPAAAGDTRTIQKEGTVMQEKPGTQETTAVEAAANTSEPTATAASESGESTATASTETIIAAQAQRRELPVRPIVVAVFLVMLAFSGYHYWQENRDSGVAAPPPVAGSYNGSAREADWGDIPQKSAIAVVGATREEQPATAATESARPAEVATQPENPAGYGFADSPVAEPPASAATMDTGSMAVQPAVDTAPSPPAQAEMEAPQSAKITASQPPQAGEITASEPQQPQATAVAAPPARPAQPQPRYGAPGYGYYPQQPNWQQQPYYQPAYQQQYPAR